MTKFVFDPTYHPTPFESPVYYFLRFISSQPQRKLVYCAEGVWLQCVAKGIRVPSNIECYVGCVHAAAMKRMFTAE